MTNFHKILHEAFCRKDINNLFKWFNHIKLDGRHGKKYGKIFFSWTKKELRLNRHMHRGLSSTQFVQMMILGWPLTFVLQGQICVPKQNFENNNFHKMYKIPMAETYNV